MELTLTPLGAGQDIGRSCIIASCSGTSIMLDCGVHMGYKDERRYPDFAAISPAGRFTEAIQAVVITHFHLDHIGALPYFTEVLGYRGPVIMTHATHALAPLMLDDYLNIVRNLKGGGYTRQQVADCLARVTCVGLREPLAVSSAVEVTAFYAGHVLGACMFRCRLGAADLVYTGDYNMTADRHLGAASVPPLCPDVLVTESTYATTMRESRRGRENEFLQEVLAAVRAGGKVLIPVFALGRAQELTILVSDFWRRMDLTVPIYFSQGMVSRAAALYQAHIDWASQQLRHDARASGTSPFAPTSVQPWRPELLNAPGPCVLFATPGMLHAGLSLEVFKAWCQGKDNLAVLPGYCVAGTVGHQLATSKDKVVQLDRDTRVQVKCKVIHLAFSAHADAKGILQLIQHVRPANVVLVHGEAAKMRFMEQRVRGSLGLPCHAPANGDTLRIPLRAVLPVHVSAAAMAAARATVGAAAAAAGLAAVAASGAAGAAAAAALAANLAAEFTAASPAAPPLAADAEALLRQGSASPRAPALRLDGVLVALQLDAATKYMRLVTPAEAAALQRTAPGDSAAAASAAEARASSPPAARERGEAPAPAADAPPAAPGHDRQHETEGRAGLVRGGWRAVLERLGGRAAIPFAAPCTIDAAMPSGHGVVRLGGDGAGSESFHARLLPEDAEEVPDDELLSGQDAADEFGDAAGAMANG